LRLFQPGCESGSALFLEAGYESKLECKTGSRSVFEYKFRGFRGSKWSHRGP
jgi:hypothetical protein